jgi:hypothetical protein
MCIAPWEICTVLFCTLCTRTFCKRWGSTASFAHALFVNNNMPPHILQLRQRQGVKFLIGPNKQRDVHTVCIALCLVQHDLEVHRKYGLSVTEGPAPFPGNMRWHPWSLPMETIVPHQLESGYLLNGLRSSRRAKQNHCEDWRTLRNRFSGAACSQ